MDARRYAQVRELFTAAIGLSEPQREQLLRERSDDADLQAEVRRLLANDAAASWLLPEPPVFTPQKTPETVGPYRITRKIADGGMGTVYEAVQSTPHRTVALKMIRPEFATQAVLRRFAWETQVLGLLQHPGIARIYEAGTSTTEFGEQPYFAMELVKGESVREHADRYNLDAGRRLALIAEICDAVHYAHQKGVIHRDLKPGNILVDEAGRPRVLDFGVARASSPELTPDSLRTRFGELIGTLAYMSPEQAAGDAAQIDTRTDIYALGAIGYELIAGTLPHPIEARSLEQVLESIRDREPLRLGQVRPELDSDIETIVAKAMAKDKDRRYASAAELAADIRRFLHHRPIQARPPSMVYQLSRFARRNRGVVAGLAVSLVLLFVGLGATTYGMVQARTGRDRVTQSWKQSEAVISFFEQMLTSVDPASLGRDVLVADILSSSSENLASYFPEEPLVQTRLTEAIGIAYLALGRYPIAAEMLDQAHTQRVAAQGDASAEALFVREKLAEARFRCGAYAESAQLLASAVHGYEKLGDEIRRVRAIGSLAAAYRRLGELDKAESLYLQFLDAEQTFDRPAMSTTTAFNLGELYRTLGRLDEAEEMSRRALAIGEARLGANHEATVQAKHVLALVLRTRGELEEAEALYTEVLNTRRSSLGEEHMLTIVTVHNLGSLKMHTGDLRTAMALLEDSFIRCKAVSGPDHLNTMTISDNVAVCQMLLGDYTAAESRLADLVNRMRTGLTTNHPALALCLSHYAEALAGVGRASEAHEVAIEARRMALTSYDEEHTTVLSLDAVIGRSLDLQGESAEAIELLARIESADAHQRISHKGGKAFLWYGECLANLGRYDEALPALLEAKANLSNHRTSILWTQCMAAIERTEAALAETPR